MGVPFRGIRKLPSEEREPRKPKKLIRNDFVTRSESEVRCKYNDKDICQGCLQDRVNEIVLSKAKEHFYCAVCGWKCSCFSR